jgi:hypothetical protein
MNSNLADMTEESPRLYWEYPPRYDHLDEKSEGDVEPQIWVTQTCSCCGNKLKTVIPKPITEKI